MITSIKWIVPNFVKIDLSAAAAARIFFKKKEREREREKERRLIKKVTGEFLREGSRTNFKVKPSNLQGNFRLSWGGSLNDDSLLRRDKNSF